MFTLRPFRFAKGRTVRRKPGTMNKMEAAYGAHLQLLEDAGEYRWVAFEAMTFKLAPDTRYTPDFVAMTEDGTIEVHEIKGWMEDDALVKLKVFAAQFWWLKVVLVTGKAGAWVLKEIKEA